MEAEIKELNQFLVGFKLEGVGFAGYRRLFHEGDVKGFDFQWGGRIYGVGDYNYQNIKKSDRPNLRRGYHLPLAIIASTPDGQGTQFNRLRMRE